MLKILVKDPVVTSRQMTGGRSGGTFEVRDQEAWIDLPSGERRKLRLSLERGAQPFATGAYTLNEMSFDVGQYGDLVLVRNLKLTPFVASAAGAASARVV